jgi:hypothetical protein
MRPTASYGSSPAVAVVPKGAVFIADYASGRYLPLPCLDFQNCSRLRETKSTAFSECSLRPISGPRRIPIVTSQVELICFPTCRRSLGYRPKLHRRQFSSPLSIDIWLFRSLRQSCPGNGARQRDSVMARLPNPPLWAQDSPCKSSGSIPCPILGKSGCVPMHQSFF